MNFELRSLRPTFLISSLMVLILTACDKLPFLDSSDGAVSACEEKLRDSLVSPSSYRRQKAEYHTREFTFDDYYESEGGDNCRPFTSSDCVDTTKFFRAMAAKRWLLASKDLKADRDISEITSRVDKQPFPKVSDKKKWEADHDYMEFIYQRNYGLGRATKLPAAMVAIEYDAANSFNASLRSTYVCRFPPTNGDRYSKSAIY